MQIETWALVKLSKYLKCIIWLFYLKSLPCIEFSIRNTREFIK